MGTGVTSILLYTLPYQFSGLKIVRDLPGRGSRLGPAAARADCRQQPAHLAHGSVDDVHGR